MSCSRRSFLQSVVLGTGVIVPGTPQTLSFGTFEEFKTGGIATRFEGRPESTKLPKLFAHAVEFEESVAYRPAKRPGYCCWVTVWKAYDGSLLLNFCERRKHSNPIYRSIPLDFWEAMQVPVKYQCQLCTCPDILPETVILRSQDHGKSWKEVGRSILICEPLAFASLPDGSILRGIDNAYSAYYSNEKVVCTVQKSIDLGNTWTDIARLEENFYFTPYRMRVLADGTIGMLGTYNPTFGPSRAKSTRNVTPAYTRTEVQAAFFYSRDQGLNWEGPVLLLAGVTAWEPEWVELASGDLLVVNCDVQGGANTRQVVICKGKRFIPQPVLDIVSGPVPETIVLSKEGLLVGTRRGGPYTCSNDMGKTWYRIGDVPNAMYQPRIIQLDDGRFLSMAHWGGDNFVGEIDQYIGQQVFHLEEHLPAPTTLDLMRDRNSARTQYINSYTATLTAANNPVLDKEIKFTVRADTRNRASYVTSTYIRRTDESGRAHLALPQFNTCIDINRNYTVQAEFSPPTTNATLPPALSLKYAAYRMTSTAGKKNTYAFFVAGRTLFTEWEILKRFPEIYVLVKMFGLKEKFSRADLEQQLTLGRERCNEFLDILLRHNVLLVGNGSVYRWNEVQVDKVLAITSEDDFVVS